jgi:hypothetical protein
MDSSNETYDGHQRGWDAFCRSKSLSSWLDDLDLQQREEVVLEYLVRERVEHCNKGSTLGVKKAAIKSLFERAGLPDPTSGQRVKLLLRGMRNEDGASPSKQPASLRHLRGVFEDLRAKRRGRQGTATWAAVCIGFFFTLRSRSYSAAKKRSEYKEEEILRRADVKFIAGEGARARVVAPSRDNVGNIRSMVIRIKRSKTDGEGRGYERAITINSDPYLCVVKAVLAHLLLTADLPAEYPVCAYDAAASANGRALHVVTRADVAGALKAVATRLGEDVTLVSSHSLRIGGATAMAAAGFPDSFVCYWGFWRSPAYRGYIRHVREDPWEKQLAERLIQRDLIITEEQQPSSWARPWGANTGVSR